jgi:hypothetical protein
MPFNVLACVGGWCIRERPRRRWRFALLAACPRLLLLVPLLGKKRVSILKVHVEECVLTKSDCEGAKSMVVLVRPKFGSVFLKCEIGAPENVYPCIRASGRHQAITNKEKEETSNKTFFIRYILARH